MKIGVICPSEIAIRRFMPALKKCNAFDFAGVGVSAQEERISTGKMSENEIKEAIRVDKEKAINLINQYGGEVFESYEDMVSSTKIDAIYIPLPPALHYKWAKKALENGKHVFLEKPATILSKQTKELVDLASQRKLAIHENYMFMFHQQLKEIDNIIKSGELGDIRLYRISFGFPRREKNDFRYNKLLGGGALIDAGGYTIRYASKLLGNTAKIKCAQLNYLRGIEVDMYGSATMVNSEGTTAQLAFGMDNNYKCELEVWGSKGSFTTGRILTAPEGFTPMAIIKKNNEEETITLPADDSFLKSIKHFAECINDEKVRESRYMEIIRQSEYIDEFKKIASK